MGLTCKEYEQVIHACNRAEAEVVRARAKFPAFNSTHEAYAVILEELDEAWAEIKANNTPRSVEEMVQVAAMAIRFIAEFGDSNHADQS